MPGFDKTGPTGQGSQTGRKSGKCNPNSGIESDTTSTNRPRRRLFGFLNRNQDTNGTGQGRGQGHGQRSGRQKGLGKGLNQQ